MTTNPDGTMPACSPEELVRRLQPLVGCPLPFHLTRDWQPAATLEQGSSPHRLMVLSLPKAGTYFIAELLKQWGVAPTHLHLSMESTWDYRQRTLDEIRNDSFRYEIYMPVEQSLALVRAGQFAVGHLECLPHVVDVLRPFRKIFIYRDLRDALISQMRFLVESPSTAGRIGPWKDLPPGPSRMAGFLADPREMDYMFGLFRGMAAWLKDDEVCRLSFEDLYGDAPAERRATLTALHRFVGCPAGDEPPEAAADRLRGATTRTWSGERSSRHRYWSDDAERLFRSLGGPELNASYGYSDS